MNRRSFMMALFGGMAAAGLGGAGLAEAATPPVAPADAGIGTAVPESTDVALDGAALDKADAEFSQYYYYRRSRPLYRRPRYIVRRPRRVYRRPRYVYRRPVYVRPRRRVFYY